MPRRDAVIFRREREGDICAVFPFIPATVGCDDLTVYCHMGGHSPGSREWYRTTRPARPEEYADLKAELEGIGYDLDVRKRISKRGVHHGQ